MSHSGEGGRLRRSSSSVDVDRVEGGRTFGDGFVAFVEGIVGCGGFSFSLSRAALRPSNLAIYP